VRVLPRAMRSLAQALSPAQADPADRHCDGGLGRLDDRDPDGLFEIVAVTDHAGAAHDQHVGAVMVSQPAANIDHAAEGHAAIGEFGDAEVGTLVAPRSLTIEACRAPEVAGPPPTREGVRDDAAPGRLTTPGPDAVAAEFGRLEDLTYQGAGAKPATLIRDRPDSPRRSPPRIFDCPKTQAIPIRFFGRPRAAPIIEPHRATANPTRAVGYSH